MLISRRLATSLGVASVIVPRIGRAADAPVRIGAIYPLSGSSASSGQSSKAAIEVGVDIVNNAHPELAKLPLAATEGLPNLGGRKIEVVWADHQGNPATAQSEALRLVTQEKVVALIGCYQSSCTLTASAVAERYGIPFLSPDSSSPNLTERGFKWFFRTTPIGTDFGKIYAEFLSGLSVSGKKVETVAIVNENTEYGTSTAEAIAPAVTAKGLKVVLRIPYNANSSDVSAQVLQLKGAAADAVIFVSYTSDSILFIKTMHSLDYKPPVVIGDDAGFSDNAFITSVGAQAQGAIDRSSYDIGKPGSVSFLVNEMVHKVAGHDLDDTAARGMQGFLAMADAINAAGATAPAKIQAALRAQDLKADQLMIGYNGIKYDAKGQNELASALIVQLDGGKYGAVWPPASAVQPLALPFKGWS